MEIQINNRQKLWADLELLRNLAKYVLESEGAKEPTELSITLVSLKEIQNLNLKYRAVNQPTDVLAFPLMEPSSGNESTPQVLGEVVISPETAREQASEYGQDYRDELCLLLVHGILHLLGYNHQGNKEKAAMVAKQEQMLDCFRKVNSLQDETPLPD